MSLNTATKRVRRFKHGATVFSVLAFQSPDENVAIIEERFVTSRPYQSKISGSLFADVNYYPTTRSTYGYSPMISMIDAHVTGSQTYNLHRVFFSRKKAESYAKLVRSGCDVSTMFPGDRIDWDEAADDIDAGWRAMFADDEVYNAIDDDYEFMSHEDYF